MSQSVQSPIISALRGFRVRIVVTWVLLLAGSLLLFVGKNHLLWLISYVGFLAIRYLVRPPFPRLSRRGELGLILLGIPVLVGISFLVPVPIRPVIEWSLIAIVLIWLGYSDYRLFVASGTARSSVSSTYPDVDCNT